MPELSSSAKRHALVAVAAGKLVNVAVSGLAANAPDARRIGSIASPICRRFVSGGHLVADDDIVDAQRLLWRELRLAVEPAAVLGPAAPRNGVERPAPRERVAVVLCSANLDPATLA